MLCIVYTTLQAQVTTITSEINGSGGLSLNNEGQLFIADFGDFLGMADNDGATNSILVLDINTLELTVFATGFTGASGNDFDSEGTLFQSDIRDNAIYKIVDGERAFVTSTGIVAPVGIVFDSEDNFYVCNCGNNTIRKVTPDGTSTQFASGNVFACPNGITVDEEDNLYVSNFSNTSIVKITPDGATSIIGNTTAGNGHIDYDNNSRNLYIASYGGHQIFSLHIDELEMTVIAGTGTRGNDDGPLDSATFSTPNGIAVSENGDTLYVNCAVPLDGATINPQIIRRIELPVIAVEENTFTQNIKVHPNPAEDTFIIEADLPANISYINIKIVDILGHTVKEIVDIPIQNAHLRQSINIEALASGNYIYIINHNSEQLHSGQIIKK